MKTFRRCRRASTRGRSTARRWPSSCGIDLVTAFAVGGPAGDRERHGALRTSVRDEDAAAFGRLKTKMVVVTPDTDERQTSHTLFGQVRRRSTQGTFPPEWVVGGLQRAGETRSQRRGSDRPMRYGLCCGLLGVMVACNGASSTGTDTDAATTTGTDATGTPETTGTEGTSEDATIGTPTTGAPTSTDGTTGAPASEDILVADFFADDVRRYDAATGELLGTWAKMPELDGSLGLVVGPDGHVFVASEESNKVLRFDADGNFVDVFVGDDADTPEDETGGLSGPGAVLFGADGLLYVSSFDSDAILRYDGETGAFVDVFVPTGEGGLNGPDAGMVFGADGALYVPSYYSDEVLRYDGVTGEPLGAFTPADGSLSRPRTLLFVGDHLLVTSEGSGEVVRYDAATGDYVDALVGKASGLLTEPSGMAQTADGTLLVVSLGGKTIEAFAVDTGEPLGTRVGLAGGLQAPTHMIVRPGG